MIKNDPLAKYTDGAVVKGTRAPMPLLATKIDVRILGGLAIVATERVFRNDEASSIEATVTFPVPVHATLVGLSATIDGRTLVGAAKRKREARATYEKAIDDGKTAILHEEAIRGVHMLNVGHIPAGKEIAVTNVWATTLALVGLNAQLRIPTTIGEIYGRSPLADSDDLVSSAAVVHQAELSVTCDNGMAHLVGGGLADGKATLTLNAPIDLTVTGWTPRALTGVAADGRPVTLRIAQAPAGEAPLDADVLGDRSGSMDESVHGHRGDRQVSKYKAMVTGILNATTALTAADRVRLWEFDDSPVLHGATDGPGLAALARGKLKGTNGGTQIEVALGTVTAREGGRDILLVTDGKSWALNPQAFSRCGKRITVVMVGEDALEANIGHLAALTGGQLFVAGSDTAAAITAAIASMRTPHVVNTPIEGAPGAVTAVRGGMALEAVWGEGEAVEGDDARVIGAVAAALALPLLAEEEAAALAEAHGIVCHLTSLVLVDDAGEQQEGIPAQRKVPLMAPRTALRARAAAPVADAGDLEALSFAACAAPQALYACDMDFDEGEVDALVMREDVVRPSGFYANPPAAAKPRLMKSSGGRGSASSGLLGSLGGRGSASSGLLGSLGDRTKGFIDRIRHRPDAPFPLPPVTPAPQPPVPPAPMPGMPAPVSLHLRGAQHRVDWGRDPGALAKGDLSGLDPAVHGAIMLVLTVPEVVALAGTLGVPVQAVVIALLAKTVADSDRNAARVFRAVLGKADAARVDAAAKALGL